MSLYFVIIGSVAHTKCCKREIKFTTTTFRQNSGGFINRMAGRWL